MDYIETIVENFVGRMKLGHIPFATELAPFLINSSNRAICSF